MPLARFCQGLRWQVKRSLDNPPGEPRLHRIRTIEYTNIKVPLTEFAVRKRRPQPDGPLCRHFVSCTRPD